MATKKVVVLGGGVGGLSAAHELVERGFQVEVYELRPTAGGKARSMPVPGTEDGARPPLPGEHGFRFFPGFYKHLPDTMRRIPYAGQSDGVLGNLVQAKEYLIATQGQQVRFSAAAPSSLDDWLRLFKNAFSFRALGIPEHELVFFASRLVAILTSCEERRLSELERIPWWQFIGAEGKSDAYKSFLAVGLTRTLVALNAHEASARTVGVILIQLLLDTFSPGSQLDRVLNGPTSEVWIDPWLTHLRQSGVYVEFGSEAVGLNLKDCRLDSIHLRKRDGSESVVHADYFISALPVERFELLLTPAIKRTHAELARLSELRVAWMNGLQLYLRTEFSLAHGHANYVNTRSALTSIAQNQFWRKGLSQYGNGSARECFSIDISNWDAPGIVYGKPMRDLDNPKHVRDEVLAQLRQALGSAAEPLADENIAHWFLDPDIVFPNDSRTMNLEPLLINTVGSWENRPEAGPFLGNLYLASDYVRTYSDLACMESANEAARRAVNGILQASGTRAAECELWRLHEPVVFAPLRTLDQAAFKLGIQHPGFPRFPASEVACPFPSTCSVCDLVNKARQSDARAAPSSKLA